ncbi:hypothetical protein PVAG01_08924 [Phlyctema vagabunda]|uniref:RING-type domain-containing protein n=1 Tax=Phlyctema vagabunda TaxID=108571 RepID=A0ABR4PAW3_9HELO
MAYDRREVNNAIGIPAPFLNDPTTLSEFHRFPEQDDLVQYSPDGLQLRIARITAAREAEYQERERRSIEIDREILYSLNYGTNPWTRRERPPDKVRRPVRDIFGKPGHILEELSEMSEILLFESIRLDVSTQEEALQVTVSVAELNWDRARGHDEDAWMVERPYEPHNLDKIDFSGMDVDGQRIYERDYITPELERLVIEEGKRVRGEDADIDAAWEQISDALELTYHLKRMLRWCAKVLPDQPAKAPGLGEPVALDGREMRLSWVLQRCWARALHYRSLTSWVKPGKDCNYEPQTIGFQHLQFILYISLNLLDCENVRAKVAREAAAKESARATGNDPRPSTAEKDVPHAFFQNFSVMLDLVVRSLNIIAITIHRRWDQLSVDQGSIDEEWILDPRLFSDVVRVHLNGPVFQPELVLLQRLFSITDDFEDALDEEHIENILISKVAVFDEEKTEMAITLQSPAYDPGYIYDYPKQRSNYNNYLYPTLRKIMQTNRQRRDYLLLSNAARRKPWEMIFYYMDTVPGASEEGLDDAIINMLQWTQSCHPKRRPDLHEESLTQISHIARSILPVIPIGPKSLNMIVDMEPDMTCLYCQDSFGPNSFIVKLHCKHFFHFVCLMRDWDHPRRAEYKCICCRRGPDFVYPWTLHEAWEVEAEAKDHWDMLRRTKVDRTGPKARQILEIPEQWDAVLPADEELQAAIIDEAGQENDPDAALDVLYRNAISTLDQYWYLENGRLNMSEHWNRWKRGQPRSIEVEMCRRREERRRWDEHQRASVKQQGWGLEGLDAIGATYDSSDSGGGHSSSGSDGDDDGKGDREDDSKNDQDDDADADEARNVAARLREQQARFRSDRSAAFRELQAQTDREVGNDRGPY